MTKTPRILIVGKMRAGKSTVARHLVTDYGFQELAFGAELKRSADNLFKTTEVAEYKREPIRRGETGVPFIDADEILGYRKPRRLYQDFGQLMRQLDPDIWIRHVAQTMDVVESFKSSKGVVISDGRQPNEIEWAKENGFTIIRVNADESDRLERIERAGDDFKTEDLRHETELYVDDIQADYDIWNGEGVSEDDLRRRVDEILAEIKASN